jgi:hypothetical protein
MTGLETMKFTTSRFPGLTPDDWTVQFDMVEEYASDFWWMTELSDDSESQAVPGSWIDT